MCRDPDTENGDVDSSDDNYCAPLQACDSASMFGNEGDSIDDDLHEKLYLEDPKEENEEKHWNTANSLERPQSVR